MENIDSYLGISVKISPLVTTRFETVICFIVDLSPTVISFNFI